MIHLKDGSSFPFCHFVSGCSWRISFRNSNFKSLNSCASTGSSFVGGMIFRWLKVFLIIKVVINYI